MNRPASESTGKAQRLIGTKLEPPKAPLKLVARPHLMERMDRHRDDRVTLISAPAGYGKTTLVSQWLDADPSTPVAWLSLDRLDNDLDRLVRYVAAALTGGQESRFSETEEMLAARNLPAPPVLAESVTLGIERLGRRTVLVLDDYGFIRSEAVHEFMTALVSNLPATLHLVVMSRIDPPLPLSLWRSRHWLHELRAADLRCTRAETEAFFDASDELDLSAKAIDAIHSKTEGWITGLRLALLSLAGSADPEDQVRAFSASDRLVADYLMEEVLSRQPPEIREFLAITSVLERFSPELCDELVAGPSRELLDRLYRKNLFLVPLGPTPGWYRYHHLFRQLVLERFGELTSATTQVDILQRAGAWFCKEGWTEDGLTCFLEAKDLDAAEDVIGSHLHEVISDDLSRRTLGRWLGMFPAGAERDRLPLLVASAYLRTFHSDFEGVKHFLDQIDAVCRNTRSQRQRRWQRVFQYDLGLFRAFTSYWNGDIEAAHEHASRVLDRDSDPPDIVATLTVLYYGASLALTGRQAEYLRFIEGTTTDSGAARGLQRLPFLVVKAAVHLYRGELTKGEASASSLTTTTDFTIPKYFESIGRYFLGVVAYERNQLDLAERHLLATESRRSEAPALIDHAAAAGLAQVQLARGDLDAARRQSDVARSIALESGSSMLLRGSEAVEWLIAMAAGKLPDVASTPPPDFDFVQLSISQPFQGWARIQIQSPSRVTRELALDATGAALHRAESHGVTRRVIQLSALRALALDALNRRDEAMAAMEAALQQGADLGLVRSFVDLGEGGRTLLLAVAEQAPGDEYVTMLLKAFEAPHRRASRQAERRTGNALPSQGAGDAPLPGTPTPGDGIAFEDLTNRELDVLELLEERLTNKEIAARLGISAATVKMHTLSIYRKLEVHSRRQAVVAAFERRILRS